MPEKPKRRKNNKNKRKNKGNQNQNNTNNNSDVKATVNTSSCSVNNDDDATIVESTENKIIATISSPESQIQPDDQINLNKNSAVKETLSTDLDKINNDNKIEIPESTGIKILTTIPCTKIQPQHDFQNSLNDTTDLKKSLGTASCIMNNNYETKVVESTNNEVMNKSVSQESESPPTNPNKSNSKETVGTNIVETENVNINSPLKCQTSFNEQASVSNIYDDIPSSNQDLNNNSNLMTTFGEVANTTNMEQQLNNKRVTEINDSQAYVVESPDQTVKGKIKLSQLKSKSLDNDDNPEITELTGECSTISEDDNPLAVIDCSNVIVSDVESDVEWEETDDIKQGQEIPIQEIATGKFSVTTVPLNIAKCDQTKSLTPEEELSLRQYLHTLNLSTHPSNISSVEIKTEIEQIINREIKHRLRKRGVDEEFLYQRLAPPRKLDVIDEEGSSESSMTSCRQSYLSEKKSDNEDLEDDVFEEKKKVTDRHSTKVGNTLQNKNYGRLVPQQCMLVGTKIKEPEITEARGDWSMKTVEKMTGAEVVYLTDTSSSTSSLHDVCEDVDEGVETDVSVRMITPTIEVTDTENLLKKTFISKNDKEDQRSNKEDDKDQNKEKTEIVTSLTSETVTTDKEENQHDIHIKQSMENPHEIVVLSTDNIKTNLYVKDLDEGENKQTTNGNNFQPKNTNTISNVNQIINTSELQKGGEKYDLEMKVLKCELNDAINSLIREVGSDSETSIENPKETFTRQDSSSSVSSSQCTAKYNPTCSSLNDVSNIMHDETCENEKTNTDHLHNRSHSDGISHVKDVFECVTGITTQTKSRFSRKQPLSLRDLCVKKIASFPYGEKILEELASVSERLQNISILGSDSENISEITKQQLLEKNSRKEENKLQKMPYFPLPDISSIDKVSIPKKIKEPVPPPIQPRNSSLKKSQDDHWTALPTKTEPVYVCLSPSQKMLMEKTNTVITKEDASQLVDMHKKFVDRRGYNEYNKEKKNQNEHSDNPPVVPFKSQTGSRLLALIRDPAVTNNINSSMSKQHNKSLDTLQKKNSETSTRRNYDHSHSVKDLYNSTFTPIPPPRPKKLSSSIYESDESSDFTDSSLRSMRSERKFFHYSTGNLNKEIENDISSIQNMHRNYTNVRDQMIKQTYPRRPSLPKDLCEQQMEYIRQKEKEVEAEIRRIEELKLNVSQKRGPRAPLISEKEAIEEKIIDPNNYSITRKKDISYRSKSPDKNSNGKLASLFSSSQEEIHRDKMYSEYVSQMAERQERKQQKVIKITNNSSSSATNSVSKSMSALDILDSKVNNKIEKEFISKARERWDKLGIKDPETEDEKDENRMDVYREPKVIEHKIKVIEGDEERDVQKLPSHLQEFVRFTAADKEKGTGSPAVWRAGAPTPPPAPAPALTSRSQTAPPPPPPPPVWTPSSAGPSPQAPRKNFRPVHFEETPPARRKFGNTELNGFTSGSESEGRMRTSHSAPATGLNSLGSSTTSRLPRVQNPTVTLLQKAREGHLSRGANYIQQDRDVRLPRDRASPPRGDPVHALRREYASEGEADRGDYERGGPRKMADAHKKVEGIGPTTKDGMPITLRSEVKDPSRWYKKMYDTIHKNKLDDDYVTIRYKSRRGQHPERVTSNKSQYAYFDPRSGYLSEPEGGLSRLGYSTWSDAYDSDVTAGPRRRTASVQEDRRHDDITSPYLPNNKYSTLASARASHEVYKNQPGRIENYVPGKSSVVDKEAKQWWDEVMDIFDGWLDENSPLPPYSTLLARAIQKSQISSTTSLPQSSPKEKKDITSAILSKSNMARALKESGYESDSTLIFRRREDTEAPLSPAERRAAYRDLQAGGEPPLRGFRSPAPPRQENDSAPDPPRRAPYGSYSDTESPRRYVESDVNIHYRCPVRHDPLPLVPERELARQQAEHMKRLYREQKRNKYLQDNDIHPTDIEAFDASMKELQDMQNRRHQDNFTPSQKTIVPLNRYDEAEKIAAKALYAFNGQTPRELNFRKGDVIHIRRQIDANWYEGELHGRIGLFPYNYVEVLKGDTNQSVKKPAALEGRARAKFDFIAQTNLELPLKKGEVIVLTRRIDHNWWEGKKENKTGIFPDSYVTVLQEPSQNKPVSETVSSSSAEKPVASPAAHGVLNGTARRSMGAHSYTPQHNSPALSNAPPATQPLPGYVAKPAQATLSASERGYGPPTTPGVDLNNTEPLYVDTNAEAVPYRAMYKYRPQNPDELELNEGDTVYVLEKCDDGWYVGSSQRTGRFGTFPGNYVERI